MLKLKLENGAVDFKNEIEALNDIFPTLLSEDGIALSAKQEEGGLKLSKKGNAATISYEKKCEFFRGLLTLSEHQNNEDFDVSEKAHFKFNGEMIDNSRNSVVNMKTAKEIIMYSALLGLDNILLYNEETFEVPEHPYFGYMRMGYTKKEVRELTDFGNRFGVAIIPCIQTLAHLAQTLRWKCHWDICDHGDTLLVDEEKTYTLIEDIIKSWRECVDTDIIHIGMDEAFYLGRGAHLDKYGYKPLFELMCNHLARVLEIVKKYNFKPMIWSDMFFHIVFGGYYTDGVIDKELLKLVPEDVTLVYWDYYSTDEKHYDTQFKKHLAFNNEIAFAGGAWKWSGIVPAINHSHIASKAALKKAKENGVEYVFTTAWGDNGAEGSVYTMLPTMALYAEISYSDEDVDNKVSSKVKELTSYTLEEFFALCEPNQTPTGNMIPHVNPCKYLFFQDVLMGLFDYHVNPDFPEWFKDEQKKLASLASRESKFSYMFDVISKLCGVLELKADLGVKLKEAYDKGDKEAMKVLAAETMPEIINRINVYYRAFKGQWYKESNPGGFDVQDLRFGGLKARIETAIETVTAYVNGEIDSIPELEIERLPFDCRENRDDKDINVDQNYWLHISTPNVNGRF